MSTTHKVIELKPDANGVYSAVGDVYSEPEKTKKEKSQATDFVSTGSVEIDNVLNGVRTGIQVFKMLKKALR